MSADPYIQAPDNLQSYNRYAYVMNNPLNLTDPSGFSWWTRFRDNVLKPVVVIAVAYYTGQWALLQGFGPIGAGVIGGFASGFTSGVVYGGGLEGAIKGGLLGAVTGAGFGWAGGLQPGLQTYAGHALVGCVTAVAGGGACGSGAVSAVLGKFATVHIGGTPGQFNPFQFVATAVAGGIGSVIAGGKFENGAITAAYGYLFNFLAHAGPIVSENYSENRYGFDFSNNRGVVDLALQGLAEFGTGVGKILGKGGVGMDKAYSFVAATYGTPDLGDGLGRYVEQYRAYDMDRALAAEFNSWNTVNKNLENGYLTRTQFTQVLNIFATNVSGFTQTYGSTSYILEKIDSRQKAPFRK